jgi:hypothetical protein
MLNKLQTSGLSPSDSKKLQFQLLKKAPPQLKSDDRRPCILIPYHDVHGRLTKFYRVRFLGEPERPVVKGFESSVAKLDREAGINGKKVLRYMQPPNSGVHAYFPRNYAQWAQLCADASKPLYITEGEFKAACAAKHDLPCIGLGGVNAWCSVRNEQDLIPDLEAINWEQRETFIIFDSDILSKPQVASALRRLCSKLTERGAIPLIVHLPESDEGKTGLDDFIVSVKGDKRELERLFNAAEPFNAAKALWRMNDEVCFVVDPGFVVQLDTGQRIAPGSFVREIYVNRTYIEVQEGAKGPRFVKRHTADAWLKWKFRRQYKCMTYAPGQGRFHNEMLNTWRPSGVEPKRGDVKPWVELLDYVFEDDAVARGWFEQWCAYPLQHPGTKLLSAVVIWGIHQGTGKSLLGYTLARLYGEHNVSEISQDHLRSHYNDWLVDKQLIIGDEITGSDRRADADRLKALITQQTIRVSAKYIREYPVPALANLFFTSNHPDAFFLEDTDRRFFVHEVKGEPKDDTFYARYDKWYRSSEGAAALLHYFHKLDLKGFHPDSRAHETNAKREMIDDNKSDLSAWVLRLKREPRAVLSEVGMPVKATVLMPQQLLAMYDPGQTRRVTVNGLGREMKRMMFKRVSVNLKRKEVWASTNVYIIQNIAQLSHSATPVIAAEWVKFFGDEK